MPISPRTLRPYRKSSVAVVAPTDPYFSNVSLLLHMNGSNGGTRFTDSSSSPQAMTVTNATTSTTQSKFGGASGYFSGSAYVEAPSTGTSCTFGTGDFTVECWVYITSLAVQNSIFDTRPTTTNTTQVFLAVKTTGAVFLFANGADRIVSSAGAITTNTWNHVALSRVSGQTRLFLNGTQVGSTYTDATNYTAPSNRQCRIGSSGYSSGGSEFLVGYMDEFRVTKGVGRYTSTFTPPTAAFLDTTPVVSNADAADWIDRVYANGGTVSSATASAVNNFCNAIDAAALRDRFYRLNLFAGTGGLNACLVPLYRGTSLAGTQYGSLFDTNNGPFVSGDYVETGTGGGLTGNGTSKYLLTGLATSAMPQLATGHLSVYAATYPTAGIHGLLTSWGSGYGDPLYLLEANRNAAGALLQSWGNNYPAVSITSGAGAGLLMTSRTTGTSLKAYRNGSQIGSTSTTSITPVANTGVGFGVFANVPQAGSSANYFPGRLCGYSVGDGMSDAQAAAFYTAMQAFQTALGRNI